MLPDCIAYDTARTGRRQAGVFTGLWTAGETLGLALGPGIYALVLAALRLRLVEHRRGRGPVRHAPGSACCSASPSCPALLVGAGGRCCCAATT